MPPEPKAPPARMRAPQRRRQLLDAALAIVRSEGADALTLGHLAERAGVSKPVAYDHFGTRSGLLIELYRLIDSERSAAFRAAMAGGKLTADEMTHALAAAYIECASDTQGEFSAIGAALAGSKDKARVYQELLDDLVTMFADMLTAYAELSRDELEHRCIGLVGAGEGISSALLRGKVDKQVAIATLAVLLRGAIRVDPAT